MGPARICYACVTCVSSKHRSCFSSNQFKKHTAHMKCKECISKRHTVSTSHPAVMVTAIAQPLTANDITAAEAEVVIPASVVAPATSQNSRGMRLCAACGTTKPMSVFSNSMLKKSKLHMKCMQCCSSTDSALANAVHHHDADSGGDGEDGEGVSSEYDCVDACSDEEEYDDCNSVGGDGVANVRPSFEADHDWDGDSNVFDLNVFKSLSDLMQAVTANPAVLDIVIHDVQSCLAQFSEQLGVQINSLASMPYSDVVSLRPCCLRGRFV